MTEKTTAVSYRVSSRFKSLLEAAASQANRSQTNMLEHLLYEHCKREGIQALPAAGTNNAAEEVAS